VQEDPEDMHARLTLARALAERGHLADATSEYAWLWEHMTEYEPSMVGVRNSYLLNEMERLMARHAEARTRFTDLRDALGSAAGPRTAEPDAVADWIALSVTLGDKDRVHAWFDREAAALAARPELETALRLRMVPLLVERDRWADIGRLFRDPLATLREFHERLEAVQEDDLPADMASMRPRMIEALEGLLRKNAGLLVASLLAAGRQAEARAVLEEARRVSPGPETEQALAQTAARAGVTLP
jgi:hypothetical protein